LSTLPITKLRKIGIGLNYKKMDQQSDSESGRSRDRILELLLRSEEPLGVQPLSAALGVSRNAAHQQVVALEREGLIERASTIRTKGRPSQGFRLSAAGKATFPRQYALLSKQLLAELSRHLGPDELRLTMARIGEALAQSLSTEIAANPDQKIELIAGLMRELGYESNAVDGPDGPEIEAHNCVFHDLAIADPAICEVDLSLLRSLSGKAVEHRRCMAHGERSCRFAFKPTKR
jgi:DeoR family transcriptional regulator, suf operon transcriptional repressor